ncbi:4-alpha-glucanotransferase [Arthrobacter sp. zg-Y20]|uniref:4-alpha-glucanotransferase n=1 Tax=unclassified Arthrobacter TaxID=235627 RepID=UPI001D138AA6|nr:MULTISPECIES: 4-alpha-glucanotransferase [unclassified Arthrobacter]MCC3275232.1 4-alpha-glucanotransferase [Arthrobacter sp. zg-Y20]MDK1315389.1 4-alpha-glucanotransferase [Arthrobacter sp. zg.Y20]WIB05806.1 4-alpha-glucanotransferase [Arthrobacter sp. zg-Y20]
MSAKPTDQSVPDTDLLHQLADFHHVATTFKGWDGSEQQVTDATLRRVLSAMGLDTATDKDLERSLAQSRAAVWKGPLPPTAVVRQGIPGTVAVHLPAGSSAQLTLRLEDGSEQDLDWPDTPEAELEVDGTLVARTAVPLPEGLELGWHRLELTSGATRAEAVLVVTPDRLGTADALLAKRAWGVQAQLYSVRSSRSWGIGDLTDLADLAAVAGSDYDAGFVLINPLHAAEPAPPIEPSPYLPTTRRFFNPLYIRVEAVPEYAYLGDAQHRAAEDTARSLYEANTSAAELDRDASFAGKLKVLEDVYRVPRSPARQRQFEEFTADAGQGLENFARWCALAEELAPGAPEWDDASGPDSEYVLAQLPRLQERIGFFKWLQWILDEQLEAVQQAARKAGMGIGVIHDLAVGVHPAGADAWMLRDVLTSGISVGAPPDMFNQRGQDWSQPPWHPGRLAESGYAAYRDMIRTILRHAGGIRVDHILGLFRLWWIPQDAESPGEGAYVYYDHEALIGILALEAQRAGAVVIGEDLGVFEPWVQDYLAERGVLGTSILWFEQTEDGPLAPEEYRAGALTSVNTHDLPPTAGYLAGEHVNLRDELGLLNRPVEEERQADSEAQEAVLEALRQRGLLPAAAEGQVAGQLRGEQIQQTVEALHEFILQTPSVLLGVALADLVGEKKTQNQPGTADEYPNWRIPLCGPDGEAVLLDDLEKNPRFRSLAALMQKGI